MTKGVTKEEDVVNYDGIEFEHLNMYMHTEDVQAGAKSNVENPIVVDFNELIYEQEVFNDTEYFINVGSYLVLLCLFVVILFGAIGMFFVYVFIKELKALISRKHQEQKHLHEI